MTCKLIAVTGYKNSGKNAVCNVLRDEFGFVVTGFADVLKSMLLAIDPIVTARLNWAKDPFPQYIRVSNIVAEIGWDEAKEKYPEISRLLQKLGTEGGREHLGEDVWVDAWYKNARQFLNDGYDVCVSDMRFLNEAAGVKRLGGEVWRVMRPGTEAGEHLSESQLDQIVPRVTLFNKGTLEDLAVNVRNTVGT